MRVYAIDELEPIEISLIDSHGRKVRRRLLSEFEYIAPLMINVDSDFEDSMRKKDPKSVDYVKFAYSVNQQQALSKENIEEIVRFEMTFLQSVILGIRHIFKGTSHEVIDFQLGTLLSEFVLD